MTRIKLKYGFTMVEMLLVIAIIGVLVAVFFGTSFRNAKLKAQDSKKQSDLSSYRTAIQQYANTNGKYPIFASDVELSGGSVCSTLGISAYIPSCPVSEDASAPYYYRSTGNGDEYCVWTKMSRTDDCYKFCSGDTSGNYPELSGICSPSTIGGSTPPPTSATPSPTPTTSSSCAQLPVITLVSPAANHIYSAGTTGAALTAQVTFNTCTNTRTRQIWVRDVTAGASFSQLCTYSADTGDTTFSCNYSSLIGGHQYEWYGRAINENGQANTAHRFFTITSTDSPTSTPTPTASPTPSTGGAPIWMANSTAVATAATKVSRTWATTNPDRLYLVAVTANGNSSISSVVSINGGSMTWSHVATTCSGRGTGMVSIWKALSGADTGTGGVQVNFSSTVNSTVLNVTEYSNTSGTIGNLIRINTLGGSGTCSGGTDSTSYTSSIPASANSSIFGAVNGMSSVANHNVNSPLIEKNERTSGSGTTAASLSTVERSFTSAQTVTTAGNFGSTLTDWSAIFIEVKP
jgi:prepilin-type N-terminal cleavage/methylation domain-containing protein